ncbi:MAG: RNA-binding S4 domain-containing protein [Erysipelotrichaceae bacterium]
MRLDKFLKVSRIVKRRTLSHDLAANERVVVNGKVVKPSYTVKVNDQITLMFGTKELTVRVLDLTIPKGKSDNLLMYEVVE